MKSTFVTLMTILAISAVVPANAQTVQQKNASSNVRNCWVQTDASRLTGYYDVCTDTKQIVVEAPRRQITVENVPPSTTVPDSPRDSGGGGSGGGGGGGGQR